MPSPVGHTLAGLCGFILARKRLSTDRETWLFLGSIFIANMPDLDLLVNDPSPPFGAQLLWPFSEAYFISPVTLFSNFDYFHPEVGMVKTLFSTHNLFATLREAAFMTPFVVIIWCFDKYFYKEQISEQ